MKRFLCLLLAITASLFLCGCQGNWGNVNLNDPVNIPENGMIDKNTIVQIKNENAIAVFVGTSGDLKYEWTVFGSDILSPKDINLSVQLGKTQEGHISVSLKQTESFGLSATLAIHLNEQWDAQTATAFEAENAFAPVSITGGADTILNVNLDGTVTQFIIQPDPTPKDQTSSQDADPSAPVITTEPTQPGEQISLSVTPSEATEETVPDSKPNKPAEETSPAVKPTEPAEATNLAETTQPAAELSIPAETEGEDKDKYNTDPIPEGKPKPVEPENQDVNKGAAYTCTFSIECSTILNNLDQLEPGKLEMLPSSGVILPKTTVTFYEGESVFDVLQRVCREQSIHLESSWTPMYNSAYIEGIHNLYEFDCGALSGWMYRVNGWYPNYGCSRYELKDGDTVEWRYTCDLGNDIGGGYAAGN